MKTILFLFLLCILHLIYARTPNGYVDPSDIKKYDRGRYSSFRHHDPDEERLKVAGNDCVCDNKDCKHYEDDVSALLSYHKRLINSLINSLRINDKGYLLKLNTVIMEEQLQILKQYGESKDLNYDSLREVDDLISDILFQAQTNTVYDDVNENWVYNLKLFLTTQNIIIISVTAVVYMTYRLIHVRFSIRRATSLFIFIFLIIGFGWTWHNLVEEEEIKLMAARMQYPIPPDCNAADMTWWQRLTSKPQVDCEKFVRAHNKKAAWSITPQKVLSEMFGQSISFVLSHFIDLMIQFITKMHDSLPFPFNYLSLPFLLLFVLLLIVLLVIIFSRVRFRLNLLHLLHLELGSSSNQTARPHYIQRSNNVYIEEIGPEPDIDLRPNLQPIPQQRAILEPRHNDNIEVDNNHHEIQNNIEEMKIEEIDKNCLEETKVPDIENNKKPNDIEESYKIEDIGKECTNISYTKNEDKSHGDDSSTNLIDLKEVECKKPEIGNGDAA